LTHNNGMRWHRWSRRGTIARALGECAGMAGQIFISYRRDDDPGFAQLLHTCLAEQFPAADLFMDIEGHIKPGDDFVEVINDQVATADVLLAVIGPHWSELLMARSNDPADFVVVEIKAALENKKRVIPVLVGGASMPRADSLPKAIRPLARRNAVGLRPERFRADCDGLIVALKEQLAAVELARADAVAFQNSGNAYCERKDYDRAIADFNEAIRLNPNAAATLCDRGNAYFNNNDYDRAIADYTVAIRLDPKSAPLFNNRGNAYSEKADYRRAIADYTEAIRLDPKAAATFGYRGQAYFNSDDVDRAIADFTEAIRLDPNLAPAFMGRSFAYGAKGNHDRAEADHKEAIRLGYKD
jgi:tetratricopeptide (TPR) repeat protein